jgi:endoribonuclease Dicer
MPSFQVYTCKSDVNVSLEACGSLKIDETTLERIRMFHCYVFKELYKLNNQVTTLSESVGYLAVPLVPKTPSTTTLSGVGCEIHYDFLQELSMFFQASADPNMKLNTNTPRKDFNFFQSKIVRRINESANQTHYTRYFVAKVCQDLSPSSPFPDQDVAATFADYYENRYGIQVNRQQPLLLVQHVPTQVNFVTPRLRNQTSEDPSLKVPKTEIHLIPELCSVLPLSASAWSLARYLPAVVYRLEAILRAQEMKLKLVNGIDEKTKDLYQERNSTNDHGGGCDVDCVGTNGNDGVGNGDGSDDASGNEGAVGHANGLGTDHHGVGDGSDCVGNGDGSDCVGNGDGLSVSLMLHALTAKSVGQQFHSEQLELLGDSFLKLEVSSELFLTDPEKDEWVLSIYRKRLVSNDMLSTQGRRLGIPEYITITLPDLTNTSIPPGFILETSQGVKKASLNLYTHQVLGDKHVANCVEALIGATVIGRGRTAARKFLIWLGVAQYTSSELEVFYQRLQTHTMGAPENCVPSEEEIPEKKEYPWNVDGCDSLTCPNSVSDTNEDNDIESRTTVTGDVSIEGVSLKTSGHPIRPLPNFDHIERELGYSFKNKFLLLEALTHNSYPRFLSQVSETYQRMEFVGDAILDYLVTLYMYEHFPNLNHGDATDFRSGLVNNFTLAFLAVQKNLHQSLRYMSPQLLDVIAQFLKFLEKQELKQGASWKVRFISKTKCLYIEHKFTQCFVFLDVN